MGQPWALKTKVARPTLQAGDVKTRIERRLGIGCLQSRRYLKVHEVDGRDAEKQTCLMHRVYRTSELKVRTSQNPHWFDLKIYGT
jgi:hypothetical protein